MENRYSETTLQLFEDDFGLSEEVEGTYAYLGSQVVDCDTEKALRSTAATDSLVSSVGIITLLCLEKQLNYTVIARIS